MKRYRRLILGLMILMIFSICKYQHVEASIQRNEINADTMMLEENQIVLRNDYDENVYNLGGEVGTPVGVTRSGLSQEVADDEDKRVHLRRYDMYYVDSANVSVTRRYGNIGYVKSGQYKGNTIGADMTISDLRMGNGSVNYDYSGHSGNSTGIGFNKYYLGFILFEGSTNGYPDIVRGSVAKITVRFFLADSNGNPVQWNADGSVKYFNASSSFMGIGGFGSEKKIAQGGNDNVLGAPQWEWASFDCTNKSIKGFSDSICEMRVYNNGDTNYASDHDGTEITYWPGGTAPAYSFTNVLTQNVTGRQVVSNGGNRAPKRMECMGINFQTALSRYGEYRDGIKKEYYMFETDHVNYNGQTISQFQFEFGKSFGTVELALRPILLVNHLPSPPEKAVDKTTAHENEKLRYTITQKTGFLQSNARNQKEFDEADTIAKYSSMQIIDTMPSEVTYAGNLVVRRKDNGAVLSNGADYTVSQSGTNLTITFTGNFLQNRMAYLGEEYEVAFDVTVNDLTYAQAKQLSDNGAYTVFTANNTVKTIINGTSTTSDRVTTQILFDILTKADLNTNISSLIANIKGGESNKQVIFSPKPGYYIETVEWQSQTQRYADTVEGLANVSDIPSNGKVTIPERKNGTTYDKFTQTMDNSEGNTLNYDPFGTTIFSFNNVDNNHFVKVVSKAMKMTINVSKEDIETVKVTQGDASFLGGKYTVYRDEALTSVAGVITLDENGNGSLGDLPLDKGTSSDPYGEYWVKETTAPEGYLLDENVYHIIQRASDQKVAREKVSTHNITSKDAVIRNSIEITKYLEETDSTLKQKLSGAIFSATLISDTSKVYYSTETDENGYCIIENIPYGRYRVEETQIPDLAYNGEFYVEDATSRATTFDVYVELDKSVREPYKYNITDVAKKMQIIVYKEDAETGKITQGDATLAGAKYTIYRDSACTDAVETITTRKNESDGTWYAKSGWYLVGTYYVKETVPPEGYLIDDRVYTISQDPKTQTVEKTTHTLTSNEYVKKSEINIIKSLDKFHGSQNPSTDSDPAEGCKLYLTLDSSKGSKVYEAVIDKFGYAKFDEIPYGWYTITESEEAKNAGYKLMDPEPVYIQFDKTREKVASDNTRYYRIIEENPILAYVKVQKLDSESNQRITQSHAKYKIWSYSDDKYLELHTTSGVVTEFETNDYGYFITPEQLRVGKYKLVEIDPPYGYHNSDMDFEIKDGVYENIENIPTVTVNQIDKAQTGKIKVSKTAEVLIGSKQSTDQSTGLEVVTPIYETKGLEGVTYKVTAAEDIVTGDGIVQMSKGQYITIVTNEQGIAQTNDLHLGTYTVEEYDTPVGYKINDEVKTFTLDYRTAARDSEGRLVVEADYRIDTAYKNERVAFELGFDKTYGGKSQFNNENIEARNRVKFGLYAKNDIKAYQSNNVVISADSLIEVISVKDGKAVTTANIPVGQYYIREIKTNVPYMIDTNKYEFTFSPSKYVDVQNCEINNGNPINNPLVESEINFLKVTRKVYEGNKAELENIIKNNDVEAFNKFADEYGLEGASYEVYFKNDNDDYVKLQSRSEEDGKWNDVVFTTGVNGTDIKTLPYGTYYFKEIKAPENHEVDPNYIEVVISDDVSITIVNDPKIQGKVTVIHKDIDTDEEIYDRTEMKDDIGEKYTSNEKTKEINSRLDEDSLYEYVLVEEKYPDNSNGYFEKEEQTVVYYYKLVQTKGKVTVIHKDIDTDEEIYDTISMIDKLGEEYSTEDKVKEINDRYGAGFDIYELVEEKYPENNDGIFEEDEQIVVYYYRRLKGKLTVIKTDADTQKRLPGCVFTIVDRVTGKTLVENAVTDENGEWVMEECPYGLYVFTEVTAPEGYEVEPGSVGAEFAVKSEETIFEITNTGDIAVYALSILALASVCGITFIVIKKKKTLN